VVKDLSEAFPHEARIVRSSDYRMLYKTGRKIHSERFVLFWRENRIGHHRLGLTVSRKVGNSVMRNRAKRLLREIFRKSYREIPGQFDLVVNVRSGCSRASYTELRAEFLAATQRMCQSK
jgi:ribonuclease P protein component